MADFRQDQYGTGSTDALVELATLEHPAWDAPIRVVSHPRERFTLTRTVGVGEGAEVQTFIAYPFALVWPDRNPEQPFAGARFMINNVVATDGSDEPLVLAALRGLPSRARIRFEAVRLSAPNVVEVRTTRLRLTGIQYDAATITGALEMPDFNARRAGARFTPDVYRQLRVG